MNIITNRLTIKKINYEQSKIISEKNNDNSARNFLDSLNDEERAIAFSDTKAVSDLLFRFENSIGNGNELYYGAWKDDELVGFISIINEESKSPELQIEISPEFQRQGYGYEFCFALLNYLFENKTYEHIRYTVLPANIASIKLVEKLGADIQPAKSYIESILIRTYYISKLSMNL